MCQESLKEIICFIIYRSKIIQCEFFLFGLLGCSWSFPPSFFWWKIFAAGVEDGVVGE